MHPCIRSEIYRLREEEVIIDTLVRSPKRSERLLLFIKCDVEGAERSVLLGAHGVLASGQKGTPHLVHGSERYETSAMADYFPWELSNWRRDMDMPPIPFAKVRLCP